MKRLATLAAPLLLLILAFPAPTHAAFYGPIVPTECKCDKQTIQGTSQQVTTAPDYGCVLQVIQNILKIVVTLATLVMVFYIVIAGLQFIMSGSSGDALSKAKTRITNVVIGLVVLLVAWLLIDYVMKTIYDQGKFGPWNSILAGTGDDRCIVAKNPTGLTSGFTDIVFTGETGEGGGTILGGQGNTHLNVSAAAQFAVAHAKSSATGYCAIAVRQALAAGGLTSFNANHPAYAYQYGPYLTKAGFTPVKQGTYSASIDGNIGGLQAGDVVVFQPVRGHSYGHIAIYTGTRWVSDYQQSTMSSNPSDYTGGSYTIYRP